MGADHREMSDWDQLPADPKVSVIVITYAQQDTLLQTIESIAAQRTNFPFEIVIAEDCSPDGTLTTARELQRKYPHLIRLAYGDRNKGAIPNLRFAIGLARAPIIASCEGDDYWMDAEKLERQVAMLDAHPEVDMAFSRGVSIHPDGRQDSHWSWDYGDVQRIVSQRELFAGFGWILPVASLTWRAEVTRILPGWFDDAPFADMILMIAGSVRGGAAYDPAPTVAYRIAHQASFTARLRDSGSEKRILFLHKAMEVLQRACRHYGFPRQYLAHRIDDYRLWLVRELSAAGRRTEAAREALRIRPQFLISGACRRLRRAGRQKS